MITKGQPTKKQIKEFWERCGFEKNIQGEYLFPNGVLTGHYRLEWLELDLNNLFKYAVPLAIESIKSKWHDDNGNYLTDIGASQELFKLWILKSAGEIPNANSLLQAIWEVLNTK